MIINAFGISASDNLHYVKSQGSHHLPTPPIFVIGTALGSLSAKALSIFLPSVKGFVKKVYKLYIEKLLIWSNPVFLSISSIISGLFNVKSVKNRHRGLEEKGILSGLFYGTRQIAV
jgi:hypothetical protein